MGQSESVEQSKPTCSSTITTCSPCKSKKNEQNVRKEKADCAKNDEADESIAAALPSRSSLASNPAMFVTYNTSEFRQRYKSIKVLGKGSFAQVLLSIDRVTGEQRAVKVTEKSRSQSGSFVNRKELRKEVDLLKKLDHPNIMKLYEFYEDSKYCYIVTEVYSGGELFDEIIARKKFNEVDAAIIIKQILSGITYMNKHNVVHRDLKPENILLESKDKNASIKIIDFGLSTYLDLLKKEKDKLGTAYYIAPEILLSQECTEKCDVWSTGVILYILLSGCPPFGGSDEKKIIAKVQTGKYNFNLPQWKMISEPAMRLIDQMLTYKPENRISAAQALEHPWIKKMTMEYTKFDLLPLEASIKNIRQFHGSQSLANAALLYIGSKLTSNLECKQLTSVFTKIDTNGDGQLDRKELILGYKDFLTLKGEDINELKEQEIEEEVDKILESIDFDQSGFIEYSEFVTAAMDRDKLLTQDRLIRAFNMFDTDGSGKISTSEFTALFNLKKDEIDSKIFQEIIKTVDQNNDGEIDFEEFQSMLKKVCGVAEAEKLDLNNNS